jgi:hypothetical protein
VSNALFWHEAGYFDIAAERKPLLHTWSLAEDEQYLRRLPPRPCSCSCARPRDRAPHLLAASALLSFRWRSGVCGRPLGERSIWRRRAAWELLPRRASWPVAQSRCPGRPRGSGTGLLAARPRADRLERPQPLIARATVPGRGGAAGVPRRRCSSSTRARTGAVAGRPGDRQRPVVSWA